MSTPRIAPVDPPYPPDLQADFDKLMRGAPPLLVFRTVARNPRVLRRLMAGALLDRGSIESGPPRKFTPPCTAALATCAGAPRSA